MISVSRMAKVAVAWTAGQGADEGLLLPLLLLLLLPPPASSRSQRSESAAAWVAVRATSSVCGDC
jgi:hypothetical protein